MFCENIIDTVDLLLTDRVRDILRVGDRHLNTISVFGDRCICLLSFYGSCISIRSTLSFPTARSIFYIFLLSVSYKIVAVLTGKCLMTIRTF